VVKVCGAMDIGVVINSRTLTVGVRGAIMWGIGCALREEIILDGHRSHTSSLVDYKIPRFSDVPEIDIKFLNLYDKSAPRGCGEMPVVPTIAAIANAVRNAIGKRIYSIPITPEKVRKAISD
jgi:nicotinate dehydrogenase subunit B